MDDTSSFTHTERPRPASSTINHTFSAFQIHWWPLVYGIRCTRRTRSFVEDIWDEKPAIFDSLTVWEFRTRKHVPESPQASSHLESARLDWPRCLRVHQTPCSIVAKREGFLTAFGLNAMTAASLNNGVTATSVTTILVM
ncbi:hypothetical protein M422DRAFT_39234, partial [Sphaerobolus stellatus SS14]